MDAASFTAGFPPDTIARGVENGMVGYVGRKADGNYAPFHWNSSMLFQDVEISDDVFLIQREVAEVYKADRSDQHRSLLGETTITSVPGTMPLPLGSSGVAEPRTSTVTSSKPFTPANIHRLVWSGEVPHQKWMNFYTKVLSKFSATTGLKLTLRVEVAPAEGVSQQKVDGATSGQLDNMIVWEAGE